MFPIWLLMEAAILKNTEKKKKKLILFLKLMHKPIHVCYMWSLFAR